MEFLTSWFLLFVLPAFARAAAAGNSCCAQLARLSSDILHYPGDQYYQASVDSYWSEQEAVITPCCVFRPLADGDVANAVKTLAGLPNCKFAVKSGGHMAFGGAANIEEGVTIDLSALKQLDVSQDKTRVTLGPGLRWGAVYSKLATYGLALPGGRSADVGVGGYLLGGGSSYFIPYGFGCDNVVAYKVVTATGSILDVNANSNADLFRALKGGSSNFGIVTAFTLRTFKLGGIWGGNMIYSAASTADQQLQAFYDFLADPRYDVNAAVQMSISFAPSVGVIFVNQPFYALPIAYPPALQRFTKIQPVLADQTSLSTLPEFAELSAQSSPYGSYQMAWSLSIENDLKTLHAIFDAFNKSTASIASVPGIAWSITLEPLPKAFLSASAKLGGNSLGLSADSNQGKGLILIDSSFTWSNENDTQTVRTAGLKLLNDISKASKQLGSANDWVDLNHADYVQDPLSSYGIVNEALLRLVSLRYDPRQVFQYQVPGGFKLYRS